MQRFKVCSADYFQRIRVNTDDPAFFLLRVDRVAFDAGGFRVVLRRARGYGQPVQVDRSATLTDSNSHPSFAVDRYRLTAQPTE